MSTSNTPTSQELLALQQENAQLRKEILGLRQFIDSMQNLIDAVETKIPDAQIMVLLSEVLENALHAIDAKDGSLLVLDEDTRDLVFVLARGDIPQERLAWHRIPPGEGIAGWVAQHKRATIVNEAQQDERFYPVVDLDLDFRTRSVLAAPLMGGDRVLGVIEVLNKQEGKLFNAGDQTLLTLICRFAGELLYTLIERPQSGVDVSGHQAPNSPKEP